MRYLTTLAFATVFCLIGLLAGCNSGGGGTPTETVDMSKLPANEAVHVLAATGDLEQLKSFLQQYPDLKNARSIRNRNLLHTAAENGQSNVVQYLLEQGFNPNEQDDQGAYPHELASAEGHTGVAQMLADAVSRSGS